MNILNEIADFLQDQGIDSVNEEEILEAIMSHVAYKSWPSMELKNLMLIKLQQPVDMRKEIFLGSLMFSSFLGQSAEYYLKKIFGKDLYPIVSDISSHYFLLNTDKDLLELKEIIWNGWLDTLPEAYFNMGPDLDKGLIGGQRKRLSEYYNSNIQPYPVMVIPKDWMNLLERSVRSYLWDTLSEENWFDKKLHNILATFAFFYGTNGNETQSPAEFIRRLVTDYAMIDSMDLALALNVDKDYDFSTSEAKSEIQNRFINKELLYKDKLKAMFEKLLDRFKDEIEKNEQWLTPYHENKNNYLDLNPAALLNELVRETTFAGEIISKEHDLSGEGHVCRMCGTRPARLEGATIIANDSFTKFHNHSFSKAKERICINCGFFAFLHLGLAGISKPIKGWIPKQENLLFCYIDFTENEVIELNKRIKKEIRSWQKQSEEKTDQPSQEIDDIDDIFEIQNEVKNYFRYANANDVHVFKLGIGKTPLCLIALPQNIALDQKRYQANYYKLMHVILWIRKLNNNQGVFFFNTLPKLCTKQEDKVYINNKGKDLKKAEKELKYLRQVVWKLSRFKAKDRLKYRLHLAEIITEKPLEVFSHLLRENFTELPINEKARLTNLIFELEEGSK